MFLQMLYKLIAVEGKKLSAIYVLPIDAIPRQEFRSLPCRISIKLFFDGDIHGAKAIILSLVPAIRDLHRANARLSNPSLFECGLRRWGYQRKSILRTDWE